MGLLNLIIVYYPPIVVENVVSERPYFIVGSLSAGVSNNAIRGCRVDTLLQIPQIWVIALDVTVGLKGFF